MVPSVVLAVAALFGMSLAPQSFFFALLAPLLLPVFTVHARDRKRQWILRTSQS